MEQNILTDSVEQTEQTKQPEEIKQTEQINQPEEIKQAEQIEQSKEIEQVEQEEPNPNQENKVFHPVQNIPYIPQRPQRPRVRNNVTGKFDIKFASASLTFIHGKTGQLHCNEYRWGKNENDGKNQYHLIGGKVEASDRDILYTAVREFVEETNIFMDKSLIKDNEISKLSNKIYYQVKDKIKYFDIQVSQRANLYHRCFLFNVNKFSNVELRKKILGLPQFYNNLLNPDIREIKELNYLKWINNDEKENIQNDFTSLLKDYFLNVYITTI